MQLFYKIILFIGIGLIALGVRFIYVGQDKINNANSYAELVATASNIEDSLDQIVSGHYREESKFFKYQNEKLKRRAVVEFENQGQNQLILGGVTAMIGLLMIVFGRAKIQELSKFNDANINTSTASSKPHYILSSNRWSCGVCDELNDRDAVICKGCGAHLIS